MGHVKRPPKRRGCAKAWETKQRGWPKQTLGQAYARLGTRPTRSGSKLVVKLRFQFVWSCHSSSFIDVDSTQTVMCLTNGKHADPRVALQDIPEDVTISLRVCALPGGAKALPETDCVGSSMCRVAIDHPITGVCHIFSVCNDELSANSFQDVFPQFHFHTLLNFIDGIGSSLDSHVAIGLLPPTCQILWSNCAFPSNCCVQFASELQEGKTFHVIGPVESHTRSICVKHGAVVADVIFQCIPNMLGTFKCIASQNGIALSLCTPTDSLDHTIPIRIRPAMLPGAGKSKQDLKTKLRTALIAHGVPDSGADARVQSVLQGVPNEKLRMHESEDDEQFWSSLKSLASENRIRLVTPIELRDYQKQKRFSSKAESSTKPAKQDRTPFRIPPVHELNICPKHFVVNDCAVELIPATRFGPDAKGVAIMTVPEALKHANAGVISADPLAILAIGTKLDSLGPKLMVPAYNKEGAPLLVPAVLLQYGDEHVEFRAAVPSAEIQSIDAITLEFTLRRSLINKWESTATPMHFLGVQCPELRGEGKIISSWSVRSYKERKVVPFAEAQHWHGYLKLDARFVDAVLKRSGQQGIFFTPRGQDKKPDSRYAVLPLPGFTLEKIREAISDTPQALGIAVLSADFKTFGVRCRKEAHDQIKLQFFPESLKVDAAEVHGDESLFSLNHLTSQLSRENMDLALQEVQWDARAIKPTGPDSWLIASKVPPPSSHLCINGALTVVTAKKQNSAPQMVMTRTDMVTQVTGFPDGSVAVTKHSRMDEIRADIQSQLEELVAEKMNDANQKIIQLSSELQTTQEQLREVRADSSSRFDQIATQVQTLEQGVASNATTIVQQMKAMFDSFNQQQSQQTGAMQTAIQTQITGMSNELTTRIDSIEREQNKRLKTDHDETTK